MEIGDKIKTIFGNVETVMSVEEARITTFESVCKNSWHHQRKFFRCIGAKLLGNMLVCRRIEIE